MTVKYRQARWALAYLMTAVLAASCAPHSGGASQREVASKLAVPLLVRARQFISVRPVPGNGRGQVEVAVSSATTGAIVRRLLPGSLHGMAVAGLSLDRSGNLWITYSEGPAYRNDLAGGDPKPHSCANEIVVLHAATRRLSVYLRTRNDVVISGAAISPDGQMLAYGESGCATGYFNSYLRIASVRTRQSWTIGASLARCHWITDPAWTLDSRALVVGYAAHAGRAYTGPRGTCGGIGRERLVKLPPAAQPGLAGRSAGAARGCDIASVAPAAAGGLLAVEACGAQDQTLGPARLLVFGDDLRPRRQITLGRCADGSDLSTAQTGSSVLISAYLFCNPPGKPGPLTRLWDYSHGRLRLLTSVPGGTLALSHLAW